MQQIWPYKKAMSINHEEIAERIKTFPHCNQEDIDLTEHSILFTIQLKISKCTIYKNQIY